MFYIMSFSVWISQSRFSFLILICRSELSSLDFNMIVVLFWGLEFSLWISELKKHNVKITEQNLDPMNSDSKIFQCCNFSVVFYTSYTVFGVTFVNEEIRFALLLHISNEYCGADSIFPHSACETVTCSSTNLNLCSVHHGSTIHTHTGSWT